MEVAGNLLETNKQPLIMNIYNSILNIHCIYIWVIMDRPIPNSIMGIHNSSMHYNDVIMTTIASQITSLTVVYSIVYSGADQRKHQSRTSLAFVCGEFTGTGEFPAQRASNAENVSIWWRHHGMCHIALMCFNHNSILKVLHFQPWS